MTATWVIRSYSGDTQPRMCLEPILTYYTFKIDLLQSDR